MLAYLESIRNLAKETDSLKKLSKQNKDALIKQRISESIQEHLFLIGIFMEKTDPFINKQDEFVQKAIRSYYYQGNSWKKAINDSGCFNCCDSYFHTTISRLCKAHYSLCASDKISMQ